MATFTNQAFLSYNNVTTASNVATGEIVEVLSANKTAVVDNYTLSDRVAYVISIQNTGSIPFTGLTVTDNLGGYGFGTETVYPLSYVEDSVKYYVNGVLSTAPTVSAGPPLSFTGVSVPAGGNVIIVYEALVNQFAPPATDGVITNTATVTGAGLTSPIIAEETISATQAPELTINKSITPSTVTENSTLTYTFTIQNFGNTDAIATDNVILRDTFNPALTNINVSLDGVALTAGTDYVYSEQDGEFSTVAGRITVPAATYTQDATTGAWIITSGAAILTVSGTI